MSCSGLIHEARVTVDTSLLEQAAFPSPLLVVALVLAVIGVGLAVRAAPAGSRALSFLIFLAPLGALTAWHLFQLRTELTFECLSPLALTSRRLIAGSVGIAAVAFLQLGVTLTLRAWKRELEMLWPGVFLTAALVIAGGMGAHKISLQRDFERRVNAVMPVPNVIPPGIPPEAHLGRTLGFKPEVLAAGRTATEFLLFEHRVRLDEQDRQRWGVDTVPLTPVWEGPNPVPLHLVRDLVSVDAELSVTGVRDEGPVWFPLARGHRWEFLGVRGRGGAMARLKRELERGKHGVPEPTLTLEVTGEGERDGFHFYEVLEIQKEGNPKLHELVRRNGELFSRGERVAWKDGAYCQMRLLAPAGCSCDEGLVTECSAVSGDLGEGLLRLFLGVVTLGITEMNGMGDLGAGNEAGVLLIRWSLNGTQGAIPINAAAEARKSSPRPKR